jgi:alpha-mannosidase II
MLPKCCTRTESLSQTRKRHTKFTVSRACRGLALLWHFFSTMMQSRKSMSTVMCKEAMQFTQIPCLCRGTASAHVVSDYTSKLHAGLQDGWDVIREDAASLLSGGGKQLALQPLVTRNEPRNLPAYVELPLLKKKSISLVHYNPSPRKRRSLLRAVVDSPSVCISEDGQLRAVQINPTVSTRGGISFGQTFEVVAPLVIPAFGLAITTLVHDAQCLSKKANVLDRGGGAIGKAPAGFTPGSLAAAADGKLSLSAGSVRVIFGSNGMLQSVQTSRDSQPRPVAETVIQYTGQYKHSGAYLFRPQGAASPVGAGAPRVVAVQGEFSTDVYTQLSDSVVRVARMSEYDGVHGAGVQLDYDVNIGSPVWADKDLAVRFVTAVKSQGLFYTDLNDFQMDQHTRRHAGEQCTFFDKPGQDCNPIASKFYPMTSMAHVQGVGSNGNAERFSIHSMAPCGVASLEDGWIEAAIDRRLSRDDEKGLQQGVKDNVPTVVSFFVAFDRAQGAAVLDKPHPTLLSRQVSEILNRPLVAMYTDTTPPLSNAIKPTWQGPSVSDWPCDLSLLSLRPSKQEGGSRGWIFRSSYAADFAPPASCSMSPQQSSSTGASGEAGPLQYAFQSLFPGCPSARVVPITLGGQVDTKSGAGDGQIPFGRAPEVSAFEFACKS